MARRKKGRPLNGVLVMNKHTGLTSNALLQEVRRLFNAQKAGHTGALDPLATGVLPVCFGEATKFSKYLLDADKAYVATAKLGVITDSGDCDGQIVETRLVPEYSYQHVLSVVNQFLGKSEQTPSMFSALKHQGRPLYEWARKGIEVERKSRPIEIYSISLDDFSGDSFTISVKCSKGTYIRSLVEDIGLALGAGAHVTRLHRTQAGQFTESQSISLEALKEQNEMSGNIAHLGELDHIISPVDVLLNKYPQISVNFEQSNSLSHGQQVKISEAYIDEDINLPSDTVRLYYKSHFLGVGRIDEQGICYPVRLMVNLDLA